VTAKKTTKKDKELWQVVQEKLYVHGTVASRRTIGTPRALEGARKIAEYRNTVEARNNVRYRVEKVDEAHAQ
jgi:hypothetical protein